MDSKIEIPYKTEREKVLFDFYMYFIESNEGITENLIKTFKKDVEKVRKENYLYKKTRYDTKRESKTISK